MSDYQFPDIEDVITRPAERWRRIYVASSWRNPYQQAVVEILRHSGHMVYDFKNPRQQCHGFHWSEIDDGWQNWDNRTYRDALHHQVAIDGYSSDMDAMKWADTFIGVMPFGRSASLEMGWACGTNKLTLLLLTEQAEPELMVKMIDHICVEMDEVLQVVNG